VIIAVVILSFYQTTQTNQKLADAQEKYIASQSCTEDAFARLAEALNQRTAPTAELNAANKTRAMSEGELFGFITNVISHQTDPNQQASPKQIERYGKLIGNYFTAIQNYLVALNHSDQVQKSNPIPTRAQYRACLAAGSR
jgi:hypothetical protein